MRLLNALGATGPKDARGKTTAAPPTRDWLESLLDGEFTPPADPSGVYAEQGQAAAEDMFGGPAA